jgi:DNA adenine methylase/adenine-specific DNA-methyltransferase
MFSEMATETTMSATDKVASVICKYNLSKSNRGGFESLRNNYNNGDRCWQNFYALMCYSFNYQFRFNNNKQYNSSFGINKSSYNKNMENRLRDFMYRLSKLDIMFSNKDFREFDFSEADENDLVYLDPPYLI